MLLAAAAAIAAEPQARWPLWDAYCARFLDAQGRVIDRHAQDRSTSEGQAYGMFFALAADDRARFDALLKWTENNLARGDLAARLPAWLWGKHKDGSWKVLDDNPASDADTWMAYTLIEAGRLWNEPGLRRKGKALAARAAREETARLPGLGRMLLPGPRGFHPRKDEWQLNPSYLPLQVLWRLARAARGPWEEIAERAPEVVRGSAPHGFALDWIAFRAGAGFDAGAKRPASYDAIRVYLWAGMLDPKTRGRGAMLEPLRGMRDYLRVSALPPAEVAHDGRVNNPDSSVGFSAAVMPFLAAIGETGTLEAQRRRLAVEFHAGLYGKDPRYYDQNLALFATGWSEGRFRFGPEGELHVRWR